jgi:hypothetical protein
LLSFFGDSKAFQIINRCVDAHISSLNAFWLFAKKFFKFFFKFCTNRVNMPEFNPFDR